MQRSVDFLCQRLRLHAAGKGDGDGCVSRRHDGFCATVLRDASDRDRRGDHDTASDNADGRCDMTVQGIDRLKSKMRRLTPEMEKAIIKSYEQGAGDMVGMARSLAPVDTGALRNSIAWKYGDPPGGAIGLKTAGRGGPPGTGDPQRISIYAGDRQAYYARWVEFGTVERAAQAFFFPAWRSLRKKITSRNRSAINRAVKKVAAGGN